MKPTFTGSPVAGASGPSNAALDTADDELESADSEEPPLLLHATAVNANKATSAGYTATRTSLIPVAPASPRPVIVVELLRICPPSVSDLLSSACKSSTTTLRGRRATDVTAHVVAPSTERRASSAILEPPRRRKERRSRPASPSPSSHCCRHRDPRPHRVTGARRCRVRLRC